jgi:hypothetical protein
MENSEQLEEPQGKRVNVFSGAEQVAAAAEQQGVKYDEGAGSVEDEKQERERRRMSWRRKIWASMKTTTPGVRESISAQSSAAIMVWS